MNKRTKGWLTIGFWAYQNLAPPAEFEALGRGLLIDERKPDGDRVLVWTE